jgi:serine phosphatase RsbU (regulator of sigma subunit)
MGSALAIYTDGLVEVRSDRREEFGTGRLARLVQRHAGDHAEMVVKQCLDEIDAFAGARLRDDATIVLLSRNPDHER